MADNQQDRVFNPMVNHYETNKTLFGKIVYVNSYSKSNNIIDDTIGLKTDYNSYVQITVVSDGEVYKIFKEVNGIDKARFLVNEFKKVLDRPMKININGKYTSEYFGYNLISGHGFSGNEIINPIKPTVFQNLVNLHNDNRDYSYKTESIFRIGHTKLVLAKSCEFSFTTVVSHIELLTSSMMFRFLHERLHGNDGSTAKGNRLIPIDIYNKFALGIDNKTDVLKDKDVSIESTIKDFDRMSSITPNKFTSIYSCGDNDIILYYVNGSVEKTYSSPHNHELNYSNFNINAGKQQISTLNCWLLPINNNFKDLKI